MAKLRGNIKGQNGGRNGGKSGNLGAELRKRKVKKDLKLSNGRRCGRTFSGQLFFLVLPTVSSFSLRKGHSLQQIIQSGLGAFNPPKPFSLLFKPFHFAIRVYIQYS
jgi:hypothetical protein